MRLYYLLEGENEIDIYREWTHYLNSGMRYIKEVFEPGGCKYYIFSAKGYPHIIDDIPNACNDCVKYNYDQLFICLDQDNNNKDLILEEIQEKVKPYKISYHVIFQKRCIETWLMSNSKIYKKHVSKECHFWKYHNYYNVSVNDPEEMGNPDSSISISQYHYNYLRAMLMEKRICYSKGKTNKELIKSSYLNSIRKRIKKTNHTKSLDDYLIAFDSTIGIK